MEAIYRVDGNRVVTSPNAGGPWDVSMQHGSAPAALVTWAAERVPTPVPMRVARVTIDLMRPVPVAPLTLDTRVLREGRKIQLCAVRLLAGDTLVVSASVLKVRSENLRLPPEIADLPVELPMYDQLDDDPPRFTSCPFLSGLKLRTAQGGFAVPGPGATWLKVDWPLVEGSPVSQAMRAAVTSDFCNGISSVLRFDRWTYINADLTISFARQPVGEWILLDAESWLSPEGGGIAAGRLADRRGYFGRAVQSLVIEKR